MVFRIIQDKVETALIETALLCQKTQLPMRCLYLPHSLTDSHLNNKTSLQVNLKHLDDVLTEFDIDSLYYVCEDGDVFILSRQITNKVWEKLLPTIPTNILSVSQRSLIKLLEMQVDHDVIVRLCQDKIRLQTETKLKQEAAEEARKQEEQKTLKNNLALDLSLNQQLIRTIDTRRQERKSPSVLVVEDDPFSQKLVRHALRDTGDIHLAATGREGLQALIKNAPDVVFLDIGLPDVTGLSILDEIFQADPNAFIVMLSGNGSRENVVKAIQKGAKDFISKPFTIEKLYQVLGKCPSIIKKQSKKVG